MTNITEKTIELSTFLTSFNSEGIAISRVKKGAVIGVAEAKENTQAIISFNGGAPCPLLVDARQINSISKEARDHFSMRDRKGYVNSIAILISSPVSRIIGNFFMGLNKPTVPTRLFTDEGAAMSWLRTFKQVK
jgi:hypothetical protein